MIIGFREFDERRGNPPPVVEFLTVLTAARLRVAARLLLLLSLAILVLVVAGLALAGLTLTRLALPGLTLTRLTLALASLLHGAHRDHSFSSRAASAGPGSPPPRDAGS